ncbi:MAG: DoxX family protein [Terriglobales bacterium]
MATNSTAVSCQSATAAVPKGWVVLLGRLLFAAIFVMAGLGHFSKQEIASAAGQGVPMASLMVPVSGVIALVGGLSILLGYRAKLGASLIILFLVPVTLMMHKFWVVTNPMMVQTQMIMFLKNMSLLGGALLISQFGAGSCSLDARRER